MAYLPGQNAHTDDAELAANPCEGFNNEPCNQPSTIKKVGETDSFGSEYYFLCDACNAKERQYRIDNPPLGNCDWCHARDVQCRPRRDFEEGMNGPVYYVCGPCAAKDSQRIHDDLEEQAEEFYDAEDETPEALELVIDGQVNPTSIAWPTLIALKGAGLDIDLDALKAAGYEGSIFDLEAWSICTEALKYRADINEGKDSATLAISELAGQLTSRVIHHNTHPVFLGLSK